MVCKVCKFDFELTRDIHYIARDAEERLSLFAPREERDLYDAVDCPKCGCQIILGKRLRPYGEIVIPQDGQISSPEDGDIDDDLADIRKKIEEAGENE